MLCAARRSSVCEIAALILGLAHILTALQCEESFYRNTPPQQVTDTGLERRCHSLGEGRTFFTLYHPVSQSNVYTALHLGQHNAWGKGTTKKLDEPGESHVHVPALYKDHDVASPHSAFHKLDALTAKLVESKTVPQCSKAGGDVYVQTGAGVLSEKEPDVLWSAVCCDTADGRGSFSMGLVQEGKGKVKMMSVKELEELVDIKELFSGGCGETGSQEEESDEEEENDEEETDEEETDEDDTDEEETDEADTDEDTDTDETDESEDEVHENSTSTEKTESDPSLEESDINTESLSSQGGSFLLYVLSSVLSLLCTPLSPVVSTLTNLPSQICYVLQEDAAVLASLPSDSFSLVQSLGSGVASGVENVGSVFYQVGEHSVCSLYTFISTLVGTLLLSFQEGLTGTGTLIGDALGLVTSALGEVWDFGIEVVQRTCYRLGMYVGEVGSEMGEQGWSIGQGIGTLVWRGQKGLGHVISTMLGIVGGVVGNTMENILEGLTRE